MSEKGGTVPYFITYNVIWANQKSESFVYPWLHKLAMFDVICFPAFVGASGVISSVLSIPFYGKSPASVVGT